MAWREKQNTLEMSVFGGCPAGMSIFGFVLEMVRQFIMWSRRIFVCREFGENIKKLEEAVCT
jgi:hypothetical protein